MTNLTNQNGAPSKWAAVGETITALDLLGDRLNPGYDCAIADACEILEAPSGAVTIIDDAGDRQFFKSYLGLEAALASELQTSLDRSLCQIVRNTDKPLCISDAHTDERARLHPACVDLGIIAYLGHPVHLPCGTPIGAICVFDYRPRAWGASEIERLARFAASVDEAILGVASAVQCIDAGFSAAPDVVQVVLPDDSSDDLDGATRLPEVRPGVPLVRRPMNSKQFLNGLWTGSIRPLRTASFHRATRLLCEALPIPVHFMEDDDPLCGIRTLLDSGEVESGLSVGDAICEETGIEVRYGSIIIIAPTGSLQASDDHAVATVTGQIAGEVMLLIISEGVIPLAEENTTLFSMARLCRKLARGRLARSFNINAELFGAGMSAVLAEYWDADFPDLSISRISRTSAAQARIGFQEYMQKLDPNFDVRDHVRPTLRLEAFNRGGGFASWVRAIREELCDTYSDPADPSEIHV